MVEELIKRLRSQQAVDGRPHEIEKLTDEAADLIERQASRIAYLEDLNRRIIEATDARDGRNRARVTALESERNALLAAAGKEAVPVAWMRSTDITELTDSEPETSGWIPLYTAPTADLEKGDGRDAWISVDDRLPKCSRTKGSMGVEVLVWPRKEGGEATAFYGRRVTDTPAFYRYGAVINHVTHWQPLPAAPSATRTTS